MMRTLLTCLLILLIAKVTIAQHWIIAAGTHYGSYSMKGLKDAQRSLDTPGIPLKIVDSFPARLGFEASFLRSFGKFSVGSYFSKASTGGRVNYTDYSGSLTYDIITNNTVVAAQIEAVLKEKERWELFFSFKQGFSFNKVKVKSDLRIGDESEANSQLFESVNIMVSPGLGARVFYKDFFLQPDVRYELHLVKDDLHLSGNPDAFMEINGGRIKADWDGIRVGLCIGYRL